jgi:putative hydrolase of the HAD superfamily
MTSPPFEALVFDLGGVIASHDNAILEARLASRCGPDADLVAIRALGSRDAFGTGAASIADLHAALVAEHGYDGDWGAFRADWCCHLGVDRSMLAYVEQLAANNRVMLFSNTNDVHWDFLVDATGGRLAAIEAYLSHEIGQLKPSPASFLHVAAAAGVEPSRSLFLDDRADNVEGARRAGFHAEVFTDEAALRRLLQAHGVPGA